MNNRNNYFEKEKIIYHINKTADDYVGISVTEKSQVIVFLPIGYKYIKSEADSVEFDESIRNLFKLLAMKIGNEYEETQRENEFDLISAVRILENYIEYGFYKKNSIESKLNSNGRIDWKKTIHSKQSYINGKKIYINIYTKKLNYNKENQIKNIQKFCLNEISKIIGSFFGISFYENVEEIYTENQMIEILKSELRNTNQDKKIEILENLIKFIQNTNFKKLKEGNIFFKYQKFQYIWQQLVDCEGITGKEKKKLQPKAKYYFWENNEENKDVKVKPSQPDTIMIDDETKYIFIFDAKYYKEDNLPNEYDIFKQIRYGEYVKSKLKKNYKIINAFILPKSLEKSFEIMNYYASSIKDQDERKEKEDYEKIYVIYVDTKSLIDNPKKVISEIKMSFIYKNLDTRIKTNLKRTQRK